MSGSWAHCPYVFSVKWKLALVSSLALSVGTARVTTEIRYVLAISALILLMSGPFLWLTWESNIIVWW